GAQRMSYIFLPKDASKARVRDAENARKNRVEIVKAYSQGKVTRRELIKWGLITSAGSIAPIGGLSPFVRSVHAQSTAVASPPGFDIPTGAPLSPLFGVQPFSTPMPRFDVIARGTNPLGGDLTPVPTAQANQTQQHLDPALVGGQTGLTGPIEGRPPGPIWAHQGFGDHAPQISIEMSQAQAQTNTVYNPGCSSDHNSGIDPTSTLPLKFHPGFPTQNPNSVWTFNGTIPPKLVIARYGEPLLFRHHNRL